MNERIHKKTKLKLKEEFFEKATKVMETTYFEGHLYIVPSHQAEEKLKIDIEAGAAGTYDSETENINVFSDRMNKFKMGKVETIEENILSTTIHELCHDLDMSDAMSKEKQMNIIKNTYENLTEILNGDVGEYFNKVTQEINEVTKKAEVNVKTLGIAIMKKCNFNEKEINNYIEDQDINISTYNQKGEELSNANMFTFQLITMIQNGISDIKDCPLYKAYEKENLIWKERMNKKMNAALEKNDNFFVNLYFENDGQLSNLTTSNKVKILSNKELKNMYTNNKKEEIFTKKEKEITR